MHVFIDDSGDGGMKFAKGSSTYLVMAACVFSSHEDMRDTTDAIEKLKSQLNRSPRWEFKYVKADVRTKDAFFAILTPLKFSLRAIVIDKTQLTEDQLAEPPANLKAWAVAQLLSNTAGAVANAKIIIDGENANAFGERSDVILRKDINAKSPGTVKAVVFRDSMRDPLLQLADMCAGAIHREVRKDRQESQQYLRVLRQKARKPNGSLWYL